MSKTHSVKGSEAYTIVENIVALALIVAVLIPVGGFLGKVTLNSPSDSRSEALNVAQAAIEVSLSEDKFLNETWWSTSRRWRIVRQVQPSDAFITIDISVYRGKSDEASVVLSTRRLFE